MRRRFTTAAAALVSVAAAVATVSVARANDNGSEPLDHIRHVTARYRHVEQAIDDGYVQFFGCVHEPLAGSMGIHFVNAVLVGDPAINPDTPEALMYEQRPNGRLELTGVEYVVFKDAWDAVNPNPPELFGKTFITVAAPNRFGIPTFYELHAWAWKANPTGAHEDWNPAVLCPGAEGNVP